MHLSEKMARDFFIDHLIEKGAVVEYWDLVSLLFGELDEVCSRNVNYLRIPKAYKEIEAMLRLSENKDAYYIMLVPYEGRFAKLFRLLSKYDARMLSMRWAHLPIQHQAIWQQVLRGLFSNPLRLVEKVLNMVKIITYKRLNLIKPYEIVFAAGNVLMENKRFVAKAMVPINTTDYDFYKRAKLAAGRLVEGRYAVFLDNFIPGHPDLKVVGWQAVNPHNYYLLLNRFFSLLEVKYGIKVAIAAHPRSVYSNNPFQGREIYSDLTPELVRDADFVVSHHSVSISYAVLNHKPIIFIYTDEMISLYGDIVMRCLHGFSSYLDAPLYNIDVITKSDQIMIGDVNLERYERYKYDFLTTRESENTTTQDIIWNEINVH